MPDVLPHPINVAGRLTAMAREAPERIAVVEPRGRRLLWGQRGGPQRVVSRGGRRYAQLTFRELDADSDRIAAGLRRIGVTPGTRLALLVRPGIDFVSLVFALFKAGAVAILIDPGMGRRNLIRCLAEAEPQGFVAIPIAQAVRTLVRRRFPRARLSVTVGRRWFWGGTTLAELRAQTHAAMEPVSAEPDDPAAIIFTTGSTGPPKGVLYTHGNFDAQVEEIRDFYGIRPGEVDLPGFPLFGLFNCAMGVTAVIPDMDPSRPAAVNPAKIVAAIEDWNATQTFGSPAIWNRVGRYCQERSIRLASVCRVMSAGAPVPIHVLDRMKSVIAPGGDVHTPYGATEALPVASITASEVLGETAERTRQGAGVCVGRRFSQIEWKVIRIVDGPINGLAAAEVLPPGEIGELIVRGPQVTRRYVTRPEANATGKIADGRDVWHRMGDAGYLDPADRFWFCGRVAHRVLSAAGPMYTIPCEAIFNNHEDVFRSALVGVGEPGAQRAVIILEPRDRTLVHAGLARDELVAEARQLALAHPHTAAIRDFLVHPSFPVDIRHNVKIFREKLAAWAERELKRGNH
jgi:acyl-CoA synthetase (AMP-forming)/AMP-acid ligase II